jgi:hypothetical protein
MISDIVAMQQLTLFWLQQLLIAAICVEMYRVQTQTCVKLERLFTEGWHI